MVRRVALVALLVLAFASTAQARPNGTPGPAPTPVPVPSFAAPSDTTCRNLSAHSTEAFKNCKLSGSPKSPFPTSNYTLDEHVNVGSLDPGGQIIQSLQDLLGVWFGFIASIIDFALQLLGQAFGFNLLSSNSAGVIPRSLASGLNGFALPALALVVPVGGMFALFYWLRHNEAKALGHLLAMFALMTVGILIALDPIGLFGGISQDANSLAASSMGIFTGDNQGAGTGYAAAEPVLWRSSIERPWCQAEFGDLSWCLSPIDPQMAAARSRVINALSDTGSGGPIGNLEDPTLAAADAPTIRARLLAARTNGQLFLAFPANASARNSENHPWFYKTLEQEQPRLAVARGSGGVGQRAATLGLVTVGESMFAVMVMFIAVALLIASIGFAVLLLLTPLVILAPAFGWSGQRIFGKWAGFLLLCLASKVVYALILGALIRVNDLLSSTVAPLSWALSFGLWAVLWFVAFKYRHAIFNVATGLRHHDKTDVVAKGGAAAQKGGRGAYVAAGAALGGAVVLHKRWRKPGEARG